MDSKDSATFTYRAPEPSCCRETSPRGAEPRAAGSATLSAVKSVDLRQFRLRPGEVERKSLEVAVEPFFLGGQRYEAIPDRISVDLEVSQASGAMVFELRFDATLSGPCMRCLGHAEVPVSVRAREVHDLDAPSGDELRSDYLVDDRLELGNWARDAIALALPEQILCRAECAGLCPVCGRDLNVEPHEHVEEGIDPRWAALQQLRDDL
jgi:uncharacterized protein